MSYTFKSASRAQLWYEWRQHGWSLPFLVAIVAPFELAMLFIFRDTPAIVFEMLVAIALTPPFMAAFVAAVLKSRSATSFEMTRPLSDHSLIAAKLAVAMFSAALTWLIVLITTAIALMLSGTSSLVIGAARTVIEIAGVARGVALMLLAFVLLFASTWKQLVQSLYIRLSGREWLVKASMFAALAMLAIAPPIAHWIATDRPVRAAVWNAMPWIAAALVAAKMAAAIWIAVQRADRAFIVMAIAWNVVVFALYSLLVWIFPELLIRGYFLALVAILAVPLARVAAAPLALAVNRHG